MRRTAGTLAFASFMLVSISAGSLAREEAENAKSASTDNQKSQALEAENEYLGRLVAEKSRREELLKTFVQKKMPEDVLEPYQEAIKQVQIQIDLAKERINDGESFGKSEYAAANEWLRKQHAASLARAKKRQKQKFQKLRDDAERKRRQSVAEANGKMAIARGEAQEKYRLAVTKAELKKQFLTNRGRIGLVIWNLPPDQELHKRLTSVVNIRLFLNKKVVWSKKGYHLDRRQPNNPISLPNVMFDQVEVHINRWRGEGGGLAEIEVMTGSTNVALNRPCEVSNIETLPIHLDDQNALTDGVTRPTEVGRGYWITEPKTKASIKIDLLGPPVKVDLTPIRLRR